MGKSVKFHKDFLKAFIDSLSEKEINVFQNAALDIENERLKTLDDAWTPPVYETENRPNHYNGNTDCLEAIGKATKDLSGEEAFCTASVIKYMWRWKKKNGVEDLKKAIDYINLLIESEENKE